MIKQTVMTTVYGVTRYGAKLQIAKQLKDQPGFPLDKVGPASVYLASKTFESLNEIFSSSQAIQAWLTECANVISGGPFFKNVQWITPLGLHVTQPYTKKVSFWFVLHTFRCINFFPFADEAASQQTRQVPPPSF